jgi:hypothetical protein
MYGPYDFTGLSLPDLKEAINTGWLNLDSVRLDAVPELSARLDALEQELCKRCPWMANDELVHLDMQKEEGPYLGWTDGADGFK